jgi:hypothetical protein
MLTTASEVYDRKMMICAENNRIILKFLRPISVESRIGLARITERPKPEADWPLWQCGNCREAFF